ncbi:Helicase associated domain protein [Streptomyces sp. NPDC047000]|uniref:DEAD/DEAH box helicase n=1 Tax=Streptomyces sp. NPDC047000 TaxID=3155474 RepID=UPI0033C6C637
MRPHQQEAVDAVVRALARPASGPLPERGLRTQVVMATGSGKTLVAVRSAEALRAGRVLVLVPSLDLLAQTEAAWRAAGRTGPVIGVSSLRGDQAGFPNTTDPGELAARVRPSGKVTVFATYASLGLGTLERAHAAGLPGWDLIVVDEAHRTSGRIGKPWAVVHDNTRVPALRRLYMTATPRLWQPEEDGREPEAGPGGPGELVASMDDDPAGPFGARCHTLTLSEAVDRGVCAPYQVVCVDVTDTALQAARLLGAEDRSDRVRGARLAALQTALVKAAAEEGFRRTLVFHHMIKEAEAFAAGLPGVAARLRSGDPGRYPGTVWADWLCGEHRPLHRRRVLARFAAGGDPAGGDRAGGADGLAGGADGTGLAGGADKAFLSSVRVLGEGVDTRYCDSVYFADVRGSMPDLVQAVGRALRMRPDEGKVASLVVPVLLGPGETPDSMLTSRAYGGLARLLEALRAHDTRVVEHLAQPQAAGRSLKGRGAGGAEEERRAGGAREVSGPARALLKFSEPRDPAVLAAFIELRVLYPERTHWLRGLEAAARYARVHGDLRVPFVFRAPEAGGGEPEEWPAPSAGFPLGQWIADARRRHARGTLEPERVERLEKLGMVWSHFDVAWEEGLTAARAWAAGHGHLLAPQDAAQQGFRVGVWLKNARAAARRPASAPGALPDERREQLEEIDPAWCPAWPVVWQRCFHLTREHLAAGHPLPADPGTVVVQGDDLGAWVRAQRLGWDRLGAPRQWLCAQVLGITPASAEELPPPRVPHAEKWALGLAAARQFRDREGHLRVPRAHVETVTVGEEGARQTRQIRLGSWIGNQRSRAGTLSRERTARLDELGMIWA